MKKILIIIECIVCFTLNAAAYSFTYGGVYYQISSSTDKTVYLTYKCLYGYDEYEQEVRQVNYGWNPSKVNILSKVKSGTNEYTVTGIGSSALKNCTSITSITIPNSVTSIGIEAFKDCTSLSTVTIPSSVTTIEGSAFQNCNSLTNVNITDLSRWCKITFGNGQANPLYYAHKLTLNGSDITELVIPQNVTDIADRVFQKCSTLTSISIPLSVKSIGFGSFAYCSGLKSVSFPNSLTSISGHAFRSCTGLTSVIIPNSVTNIEEKAFWECSKLNSITILAETPPTLGSDVFKDCGTTDVHVLRGLAETYKTAKEWSNYNIIDDVPRVTSLTDGIAFNNYAEWKNDCIYYTRTFNNTEWQALYIPFQMSYEDWADEFDVAAVNNFHQKDVDDDGVFDTLEMEVIKVKNGTLKQNHPYLIRAKSTGEKTIALDNATLYAAEENSFYCSSMNTNYTFTGTYSGVSGSDMLSGGFYSMGGGSLHQATSEEHSLSPYRWYMRMNSRDGQILFTPRSVRVKVFGEDDDDTEDISTTTLGNAPTEAYDMQGRKTTAIQRGLFITNGKKVMR